MQTCIFMIFLCLHIKFFKIFLPSLNHAKEATYAHYTHADMYMHLSKYVYYKL